MNRASTRATMRLQLLWIALSLPVAGCAMEVAGEEEPGLEETEQWALNQWALNGFMLNSLAGTPEALALLGSNPLISETFDPETGAIPYALNHAPSRQFLTYLASCALPAGADPIEFDDLDGNHHTFTGGMGLCPQWGEPEWADADPDPNCLELVSACMYTRNNRDGDSVALSIRGKKLGGVAMPLAKQLGAKTSTIAGATINSFRSCSPAQSGAARNCGWTASKSLIGTCTPGKSVTLSCTSTAPGYQMVARVCNGIAGCNHNQSSMLAEGSVCAAGTSSLSFTCGNDGGFVAMTGAPSAGQSYSGSFSGAVGGTFPATEKQVFPNREGAFFGNMFVPGAHNSLLSVTTDQNGVTTIDLLASPPGDHYVFQDAWSCHDAEWTNGDAYMSHRLCALVSDDDGDSANLCAAHPRGQCFGGGAPVCASNDALPTLGDTDFAGCKDGGNNVRNWAFTPQLHLPCDMLAPGMDAFCQRRVIH